MTEDIMPTFRQKIKLNNEELVFFHQDVNSWREKLKDDEKEEPSTLEDLCYVLSSDDECGTDPAEDLANEGNKCLKKGEWSRAISCYSSAISRNTTVARYYANRALGHLKRSSPAEAEKDCTHAISLNPEFKKAYLRRACACKQLGKCKESCDDLEVVLKMEPDNDIAMGEYEAMIEYIQKDLLNTGTVGDNVKRQEKKEIADKMKQQGNKLMGKGDYVGAKGKFTTAIELNPNDPTYYANRAICHMKLMDFKNAEKDCNEALQLDLEYVKVYIRRARIRRKLGKMYDARQDLYNAYELSHEDSAILDELEEVDNEIRKSEDTRRGRGMVVEEVEIVSLLESRRGSGDGKKTIKLNWNELRPRKDHLVKNENKMEKAEPIQENHLNSGRMPTDSNGLMGQTVQTNGNKDKPNSTKFLPRGVEDDIASKNTTARGTNSSAGYNMREVFPLEPNDPVAKFSGPFIKVRVEDAKFAMPEKLLQIPDKFKQFCRDNGK